MILTLLSLSYDVQLNPGPQPPALQDYIGTSLRCTTCSTWTGIQQEIVNLRRDTLPENLVKYDFVFFVFFFAFASILIPIFRLFSYTSSYMVFNEQIPQYHYYTVLPTYNPFFLKTVFFRHICCRRFCNLEATWPSSRWAKKIKIKKIS